MAKLEQAQNGDEEEQDEEAKAEASKFHHFLSPNPSFSVPLLERKAFRAKMKGHYKGEFNMAALLR